MTPAPRVLAVAHRGASREYPENTHLAFEHALRQGCEAIELDLRLSADGVPVVWHDRTLVKADGGRRRVESSTVSELRRLNAAARHGGRAQKIPLFEEVLDRYAERTRLLVELKASRSAETDRALAEAVAAMLLRCGVSRSVDILSFEGAMLDTVSQNAPSLRRVLNFGPVSRPRVLSRWLPSIDALSVDVRRLTRRLAERARRARVPLWIYTCNTERRVRHALTHGAAAIMSDRPAWLADLLTTIR